jgi:drug/metabolite transporter (DMT)-like permease
MLLVITFMGKRLPTDLKTWIGLAIMGLLNNAIPFSAIVYGQQYISGGLASILNSSTAFFGVILSGILLSDERMTGQRVTGVIIGILGVAIVVGIENLAGLSADLSPASFGQMLIIVASISYAFASIWGKLRVKKLGVEITATGMLITSAVWMFILATFIEGFPIEALSLRSSVSVAILAVICTAIAYLLYFKVLAMSGAGNLMLVTIIIPPFALILDALAPKSLAPALVSGQEMLGFGVIAFGLLVVAGKIKLPKSKGPQ